MKQLTHKLSLIIGIVCFFSASIYSQDVPAEVKSFTSSKLVKWVSSKEIVSAVKLQNSKNIPLSKVKEIDQKWKKTSGLDDFMKGIVANSCSEYLKKLRKDNPMIVEAFVMDNNGANVGMTNKTSDYWQGDEDKFTKSYNNGNGTIHYGKMSFDESSQTYVIQVSLPVTDNGKTIGAVTFGIDTARLK
jgi:hypothetical protein